MPNEENPENYEPVLIIEDDSAVLNMLKTGLEEAGYEVAEAPSGDQAWQFLSSKVPSFIILDWKLPSINGLAMLNRIRQSPSIKEVPVLVVSGFLATKDFSILEEFPLTATIEKPFSIARIKELMKKLMAERKWYQTKGNYIGKIINESAENLEYLEKLYGTIKESPNPVPLMIMVGRKLRSCRLYTEGKAFLSKAVKSYPSSPQILNELAKVSLFLGELDVASSLLQTAQMQSPKNVERLCQLGDISLEKLNIGQAHGYFSQALDIDPSHRGILTRMELVSTISDYMASQPDFAPISFASLLNTVGISKVREGQYEDAVHFYQSSLKCLTFDDVKARLAFNLGLCYLRWGKNEQAIEWLQKSVEWDPHFTKAEKKLENILSNQVTSVEKVESLFSGPAVTLENLSEMDDFDDELEDLGNNDLDQRENVEIEIEDEKLSDFKSMNTFGLSTSSEDKFDFDEKPKDYLVSKCPGLGEFLKKMAEEGIHVESQLPQIKKLLEQNESVFDQAVGDAMRSSLISLPGLSHIIGKLSQNKKVGS